MKIGRSESEWFEVNVGLHQGCVLSLWFFNVLMNGVVKEVNASVGKRFGICG